MSQVQEYSFARLPFNGSPGPTSSTSRQDISWQAWQLSTCDDWRPHCQHRSLTWNLGFLQRFIAWLASCRCRLKVVLMLRTTL